MVLQRVGITVLATGGWDHLQAAVLHTMGEMQRDVASLRQLWKANSSLSKRSPFRVSTSADRSLKKDGSPRVSTCHAALLIQTTASFGLFLRTARSSYCSFLYGHIVHHVVLYIDILFFAFCHSNVVCNSSRDPRVWVIVLVPIPQRATFRKSRNSSIGPTKLAIDIHQLTLNDIHCINTYHHLVLSIEEIGSIAFA